MNTTNPWQSREDEILSNWTKTLSNWTKTEGFYILSKGCGADQLLGKTRSDDVAKRMLRFGFASVETAWKLYAKKLTLREIPEYA